MTQCQLFKQKAHHIGIESKQPLQYPEAIKL
jgi:hypothetical protein